MDNKTQNNNFNPIEYIKTSSPRHISDELAEKLTVFIVNGTFPVGYNFPNEINMCKQLNVGRSTLREAYKVLEARGYITRTKRGTFVNDPDQYLNDAYTEMGFDETDFQDLMEFRVMLEAETARLAAMRATTGDIATLKKILIHMEEEKNDKKKFSNFDSQFHLKIGEASHNKLLTNTFKLSSEAFFKGIDVAFSVLDDEGVDRALNYHKRIFDAILLKDSKGAREIMKEHINDVMASTKISSLYKKQETSE